jgi:hypothetical protein
MSTSWIEGIWLSESRGRNVASMWLRAFALVNFLPSDPAFGILIRAAEYLERTA